MRRRREGARSTDDEEQALARLAEHEHELDRRLEQARREAEALLAEARQEAGRLRQQAERELAEEVARLRQERAHATREALAAIQEEAARRGEAVRRRAALNRARVLAWLLSRVAGEDAP